METTNMEIEETILITPSPTTTTTTTTLPLSHLDNDRNLRVTVRTLRFYPNSKSHDKPFVVIAEALSKALCHYYHFAGTLVVDPSDSRMYLRCSPGQGVPLVGAVSACMMALLEDEPASSPMLNRLAPDLADGDELTHPLALQVTQFACGGFVLGMCVHHAMCDGAGATQFLSAVAGFARGVDEGVPIDPAWDRAGLLGPRRPPRVEVDLDDFLGFDKEGSSSCLYDRVVGCKETIVKGSFHVSEACLNQFRTRLAAESSLSFTSFEALGAFLWKARVKASGIASEEVVKFVYSMNIRKLLKPALPTGYWGNVCVPVYVKLTAKRLLEQPLWEMARLIKKSKQNVTDEYVRSYIDFQELHYEEGITAGDHVSGFTDWRHLDHSEVDFGWGSPSDVLPLSSRLLGSLEPTFLLSYATGDERKKGGFRVLVCLPQNAMSNVRADMEIFSCPAKMNHFQACL